MKFLQNNLANLFTLSNLFSGCMAAIFILGNEIPLAFCCIVISLIMDFFDGFVARALKADSALGIQLDSLADMVSFGFVPAVAMYKLLEPFGNTFLSFNLPFEIKYIGFFIALASCLRLAIFNLDQEQKYYFKGLNTPTNTLLIFGLLYSYNIDQSFYGFLISEIFLLVLTSVSCYLLISPIKMLSLKLKSKKLGDNVPLFILFLGVITLLIAFGIHALPLAVIYYILISALFQKQMI